ncbi:ABC transporter ATP-binding protein [Candidimonas humi]|uniref:ABC transporter ATP-binding protein n=1 Tax=Candidimonas humi TaxID=683355 RepID=A0ABV8P044_9BURK|nr:ABC transporter ATP-binding protein [Candidimonas humi]
MLELRDVMVELGGQQIYDHLSFQVSRGEFVCLLGPSGCGKSTSLRVMGGLLPIAGGSVRIMDQSPADAWSKLAYVFQSPRLVSWRNALENVVLGMELRFGAGSAASRRDKAMELLSLVGLAADTHKYPSMLSGGERQRVAIARALAVDPEIIFMDEPFSALDPSTRRKMRTEIEQIWRHTGKTIVFVTHDVDEALQLADRIILLGRKPSSVQENLMLKASRPRDPGAAELAAHRARLLDTYASDEAVAET